MHNRVYEWMNVYMCITSQYIRYKGEIVYPSIGLWVKIFHTGNCEWYFKSPESYSKHITN